ncbi:hypothetical protein ACFTWF_22270 [Rhodococcus sp. NPDC056960]|jgi:hypothetical protein|uniref:hypothetical protein n=1 Tax=Rhodococcus sp. NPDC056960 TaxID=3345982 RepID=UPI00363C5CAC
MNIVTALPIVVLRIQYRIVRIPLTLIDDELLSRVAPEGPARRLYQRSLGLLDGVVEALLGEARPARPDAPDETHDVTVEYRSEGAATERDTPVLRRDHRENPELNAKAARRLDSDLTAEQIAHIPATERPTPDALARLADAAAATPDTDITPELAHRAEELSHTEATPPSIAPIPDDPGFVPTSENR